jgi:hypothetical protein
MGSIFYLESKSEFPISLDRRLRIAQRINDKGQIKVRLRLEFSERTGGYLIPENKHSCQ